MTSSALFPGLLGRIADCAGEAAAARLAREWGGTTVDIPVRVPGSKLAALIGEAEAEAIAREIGHGAVKIPSGGWRGARGRRRRGQQMLREGRSVREVALLAGVDERTVYNWKSGGDDAGDVLPGLDF